MNETPGYVKLCRDGAIWMIMNVENGYEHTDGLLTNMQTFNREELNECCNVGRYYEYCCQIYITSGVLGLLEVIEGKVPCLDDV